MYAKLCSLKWKKETLATVAGIKTNHSDSFICRYFMCDSHPCMVLFETGFLFYLSQLDCITANVRDIFSC